MVLVWVTFFLWAASIGFMAGMVYMWWLTRPEQSDEPTSDTEPSPEWVAGLEDMIESLGDKE